MTARRASPPLPAGLRVLVVLLSAWALLTVMPDMARLVPQPVISELPIEVDNFGVVTRSEKNLEAAGLRPGSVVALHTKNCTSGLTTDVCKDLLALYGGSGGIQFLTLRHPPVFVYVSNGAGGATAVRVSPHPYVDPPVTKAILMVDEVLAALFIVLSAVMVWRRPTLATWGFFAYALWYNPGQTYVSYAFLQTHPYAVFAQELLESAAGAAGIAGFVMFALRFPDNGEPVGPVSARFFTALVTVLFLVQAASFLTPFGVREAGGFAIALVVVQICTAAVVIVILIARRRVMTAGDRSVEAQRMRLVYYALMFALPPFLLAEVIAQAIWVPWFVPDARGAQDAFVYALFLPSAVVPLAVYRAVRQMRVVDVRITASRASILAVTGALWLTLLVAAEHELTAGLQAQGVLLVVILAAVTALFEKIRGALNGLCDLLWFRRLHEERALIADAEDALYALTGVEAIERAVVERPAIAMQLASAAIFRREGSWFLRTQEIGWEGCGATRVASDEPFVRSALGNGAARSDAADVEWPAGFPTDAGAPSLVVPITRRGDVVAFTLFGAHALGDDLLQEEREMLRDFMRLAGPALRESLLLARIAELEHR